MPGENHRGEPQQRQPAEHEQDLRALGAEQDDRQPASQRGQGNRHQPVDDREVDDDPADRIHAAGYGADQMRGEQNRLAAPAQAGDDQGEDRQRGQRVDSGDQAQGPAIAPPQRGHPPADGADRALLGGTAAQQHDGDQRAAGQQRGRQFGQDGCADQYSHQQRPLARRPVHQDQRLPYAERPQGTRYGIGKGQPLEKYGVGHQGVQDNCWQDRSPTK